MPIRLFLVALVLVALAGAVATFMPAQAVDLKKLQNTCISPGRDNQDDLRRDAEQLKFLNDREFEAAATEAPRALLIAPLIQYSQGEPATAAEELAGLIARLPEGHKQKESWSRLLGEIEQVRDNYPNHASQMAARGYWPDSAIDLTAADGGKYRLQIWTEPGCDGTRASSDMGVGVELFRVTAAATVKSLWYFKEQSARYEVMETNAEGPGADPIVTFSNWNGGMCEECTSISMVILRDEGAIVLDGGTLGGGVGFQGMTDIDNDGSPEIYASVEGWTGYMDLCRGCSPRVDAIFALKGTKVIQACDRFSASFEETAKSKMADDDPQADIEETAGAIVSVFLNLVQAGKGKEAEAWLVSRLSPGNITGAKNKAYAKKIQDDLIGRLNATRAASPLACPAIGL